MRFPSSRIARNTEAWHSALFSGARPYRTTTLNAQSRFIPEDERIVTNKEGGINQRQFLRTVLRTRPNRIIVGECRGAEALDMLHAARCVLVAGGDDRDTEPGDRAAARRGIKVAAPVSRLQGWGGTGAGKVQGKFRAAG